MVNVVLLLCWASPAWSQMTQQILSTFIFTRYGDRTPLRLQNPTLTPVGAEQLYAAGSAIRNRYLASTTIRGIAPNIINADDLDIMSTTDQSVAGSAQAFMQGLYPPLGTLGNVSDATGESMLANGSNVQAPLNGIQYPNIYTASTYDYNSIWLNGATNCPAYTNLTNSYFSTADYRQIAQDSHDFYDSLNPVFLSTAFPNGIGYANAYEVWDYLAYAAEHNSSIANMLTSNDLTTAANYADDLIFALYGNSSADGGGVGTDPLRAIAGRTLVTKMLQGFQNNVQTQGVYNKLNLMFGSFEPMVSFAAVAGLIDDQNSAFYNIPPPGSSLIFELFSWVDANQTSSYPSTNDIFVRFFYRNGTNSYSKFIEYPLFGTSPSQTMMGYADFTAEMEGIMLSSPEEWCTTCGSSSLFCPAFTNTSLAGTTLPSGSTSRSRSLSPVVAGVIGALVTLVVIGLSMAMSMLLAGLRFSRVRSKRTSDLGGFKGAEKLASDQDLTLPKGGTGVTITEAAMNTSRGHERVGSWELREASKNIEAGFHTNNMRRSSLEDDEIIVNPFATPVKPNEHI